MVAVVRREQGKRGSAGEMIEVVLGAVFSPVTRIEDGLVGTWRRKVVPPVAFAGAVEETRMVRELMWNADDGKPGKEGSGWCN
jgi:hypothetical protein